MQSDDPPSQSEMLSQALKSLRKLRRLRPNDVARAMGMPLRSYEHFEAGRGRLNLDRIHQFAEATDTDGFAILACLSLKSPAFALRCADNKLMMILMLALQDFDEGAKDDIARLDASTVIGMFRRLFQDLATEASGRGLLVQDLISRKTLTPAPPKDPEAE